MSRDDGFDVADVSTSLLDDPKVRDLWRALGDQGRMGHAVTLYAATVLASWRHGRRVTVTESTPIWLDADETLVIALRDVKLLDRTGRIPLRSWNGWFGPAAGRRERLREKWRRDNARRAASVRGGTAAVPLLPDRPSGRSVPSVPSGRTDTARGRARESAVSDNGATGMELVAAALGRTR